MNYPQIPGIIDLVSLQNSLALLLLSDDRLKNNPVLTEIKLHLDNEIAIDALWTLPRAAIQVKPGTIDLFSAIVDTDGGIVAQGPIGAGLVVEMPKARVISRGVDGPPLAWQIRVVAMEERNTNLTANVGTFIMAEQLAQIVLDILQKQYLYPFGQITGIGTAISEATDYLELHPGINCWGATLEVENGRTQTPRSKNAVASFAGGMCTIACPDPAATILYTTDGTPACKANPSALPYQNPFPVQSGSVVIFGSWNAGMLTSSITGAAAP